jgi:hypothetical protein
MFGVVTKWISSVVKREGERKMSANVGIFINLVVFSILKMGAESSVVSKRMKQDLKFK